MADWWDAAPKASTIDVASDAEGASPQVADLARSIYHQESGSGKNTTTSNAGAVGGMQIIPSTFHSVADPDWSIHDPVQNARAGVRYITQLLDKAGGDPALAAAGYYGGPGAIDKARKGIAVSDPRNPNAPNTLQYGQQVVSRMNGGGSGSGSNWWSSAPLADDGSDAPQAPDPDQVPNATPGVSQDAAYGFNTQGQAAGTQAPTDAPQAPQEAPSQAGQAWNQIIHGVGNVVLHPLDTAAKIGTAVKDGAVDFGQSMYDHPGQTIDNVVRGIADTATFGAADKIAAKADQLTGRTGDATYDQNLAAQRAQDQAGGAAFHVGQLGGAFLPGVGQVGLAAHAVEAVPTASRLLKLGAGAGAGAAEGTANYLGHNDGPVNLSDLSANAAVGTLGGTVLGAMNKHTGDQMAESFLRKAGGAGDDATRIANAQQAAEITQGLQGLQGRTTQGDTALGPADANALANKYTQDAANAIRQVPKTADRQTLLQALNMPRALTDDEVTALRALPHGDAVADAIQMRNRAMAMTAASPASSNPILAMGRTGVDNGLLGTAAYATGHPVIGMALNSGFARNLAGRLLGGRENRTGNIASWLKQGDNAEAFLNKYGNSAANQSAQGLQGNIQQTLAAQQASQQAAQAQVQQVRQQAAQAQQAATAQQAAQTVAAKNALTKATRMPIGGGYQTLLQGGASGLNLSSSEANQGLRALSNHPVLGPIADELRQTGAVADPNSFYALQNGLRGMKESGYLGQQPTGALSQGFSSDIKDPLKWQSAKESNQAAVTQAIRQTADKDVQALVSKMGVTKTAAGRKEAFDSFMRTHTDPTKVLDAKRVAESLITYGK